MADDLTITCTRCGVVKPFNFGLNGAALANAMRAAHRKMSPNCPTAGQQPGIIVIRLKPEVSGG